MNQVPSRRRAAALLATCVLAAGCAGQQKPGDVKGALAGPGDAGQHTGNPEDAVTPRARRLFDDAVASFDEQRKLRVFDWALLESKFKAAAEADDRFAEAWYNLGVIHENQRRPEDARAAYRAALARKPTLKQAAENLAVMLQSEGKNSDAVGIYQDILTKYPDDGAARARMAALYREAGDHERALRFAREALMREPQNLTANKVLMRTYLDRNNLNMARLVALRAKKIDENDPELSYTVGIILLKEKDEQGAIAQFKEALKLQDDYLAARQRIAEIAVKHGDWASAEEQYRKMAQYDGKNPAVHVNLGVAYKGLGKVDKAMVEYEVAMNADPSMPQPYFNLGVIFHRHKDAPEKAVEYYKKFLVASRDNVPATHPVFENIRECEQMLRAVAEAKAAEDAAKREAEVQRRREEEQKRQQAEQTHQEEEARKRAEREQRQQDAAKAVDAALGGGQQEAEPAAAAPAVKQEEERKNTPREKPAEAVKATPAGGTAPAPSNDEPSEDF